LAAVVVVTSIEPRLALADEAGPRTEQVAGTFQASPENAWTRTCPGEDGPYLEIRGRFVGSIITTEPRLTGRLEVRAHALVNQVTGLGSFEGAFEIKPAAGGPGGHGRFFTVVTERGLNHGFAHGKVGGEDDDKAANIFARFQSTVDANLNIVGQLGGVGDPRTPAVIQSGRCSGPWTRVGP
jgi:hypothetical protein